MESKMNRLENKVALITGAAKGLGEAIARGYSREGSAVVISDIDLNNLKKVEQDLSESDAGILALGLDVTQEEQWKEVINTIIERFGRLDIVVNNAGIGTHGNIETTSFDGWKKLLNINLDGVFLGTKYGVEAMAMNGNKGSIINMSSIAGIVGDPELLAYSASKGAIRLFSKSAALHLAKNKTGIRVNTIHPGYMNTDLIQLVPDPDEMLKAVPMDTFGDPDMITQGAIYLGSDESAFTTGSELVIDGGYTAQ